MCKQVTNSDNKQFGSGDQQVKTWIPEFWITPTIKLSSGKLFHTLMAVWIKLCYQCISLGNYGVNILKFYLLITFWCLFWENVICVTKFVIVLINILTHSKCTETLIAFLKQLLLFYCFKIRTYKEHGTQSMVCLFSNLVTSNSADQMSSYDNSAEQLPYIATLGF